LQKAKERLVEDGYAPNEIKIDLVTEPYPTIADGIIDQFHKGDYDMVVIGRKTMSKAEEFVLGDVCAKLIRALEGTAVLVVRTE
jgi:nucleotide-binding universal stress UspA family protein